MMVGPVAHLFFSPWMDVEPKGHNRKKKDNKCVCLMCASLFFLVKRRRKKRGLRLCVVVVVRDPFFFFLGQQQARDVFFLVDCGWREVQWRWSMDVHTSWQKFICNPGEWYERIKEGIFYNPASLPQEWSGLLLLWSSGRGLDTIYLYYSLVIITYIIFRFIN